MFKADPFPWYVSVALLVIGFYLGMRLIDALF